MQVVVYHLGFSLNIDFVFSPSILSAIVSVLRLFFAELKMFCL